MTANIETLPERSVADSAVNGIVEVRGVSKWYEGGIEALRGIDLSFTDGCLTTLLGPVGAAKRRS